VHRDVKPANVILSPTGAKVVDFGIAAAVAPGRSGTEEFMVEGTPTYLAPERLLNDVVVPASDVYSLGILLYRLLAGRSPWNEEQTTRMLTAHIYLPPTPLPEIPGIPESAVALCHRCLEKNPDHRPTAGEVAEVLSEAAAAMPAPSGGSLAGAALLPLSPAAASVPPAVPAAATDSPPSRRKPLRWAAAGVVVAAAAVGIASALAPGDRTEAQLGTTPAPTPSSGSRTSAPAVAGSPAPQVVTVDSPAAAQPGAGPGTGDLPGTGVAGDGSRPGAGLPAGATPPGAALPGGVTPPAGGGQPGGGTSRTPASGEPAPTTPAGTPGGPVTRTFSFEGGSIRATCPSPSIAEIVSSTAAETWRVENSGTGPAQAAFVTFRHGIVRVTMTVTCDGWEPSVTQSTSS